ncbi:hypothetical protein FEDK69T_08150 [Flavobacterium enshiense DK69]|nr:hypothetical protein FEDK69T_08150 [Flavobacterium enshiense DK69]
MPLASDSLSLTLPTLSWINLFPALVVNDCYFLLIDLRILLPLM